MLREISTDADFPVTAEEITQGIDAIYAWIRAVYPNGCTICGILTGSMVLVKMLEDAKKGLKNSHLYPTCFIGAKSYVDDTQKDKVMIYGPPSQYLFKKRNVVLVDDVVDSGNTMRAVTQFLSQFRPNEVKGAAMCAKGNLPNWLDPNAVAFKLPKDKFIVGFGMDFNGHYRELTEIRPITDEEKELAKVAKTGDVPHEKLPEGFDTIGRRPVTGRSQSLKTTSTDLGVKEHQHSDTKAK
jgi:hypoxanthine phosphoribosyltransferase